MPYLLLIEVAKVFLTILITFISVGIAEGYNYYMSPKV
jgi:hypothetical protein